MTFHIFTPSSGLAQRIFFIRLTLFVSLPCRRQTEPLGDQHSQLFACITKNTLIC